MNISIRPESNDDKLHIEHVVRSAFDNREEEPRLVSLIRERKQILISLVAVVDARIVGHVMVTPITIDKSDGFGAIAPLSVAPDQQKTGIGSTLMEAAITESKALGLKALFLLGSPQYYPRFGFKASHIGNEYGATDAFMHLELVPGTLHGRTGTAQYVSAFNEVGA